MQKTPMASTVGDSSFGVQSLEDTVGSASSPEHSLSRTNSNTTDPNVDNVAEGNTLAGRKRKAGNPVHPKIIATGQRIISSEHPSTYASATDSPISIRSAESPFRTNLRRGSVSSINLSQPITPLKMSPHPESAMPSTPRSGSPKSFRLSDEEASVASDTGSQAIQSSSGEEGGDEEVPEAKDSSMPQLVMPSVAVPTRRPFTEKGKCMGRLRVMVLGSRGVGKTSLIQSICRVCEDVVHIDPIPPNPTNDGQFVEVGASSRPYPSWWSDFERRRMSISRSGTGDGVLDRNLAFIDTPALDHGSNVDEVREYIQTCMYRTASLDQMSDHEVVSMLSGDGGLQIDAVLYLFDPIVSTSNSSADVFADRKVSQLLQDLCKWTNFIPLVTKADTVGAEALVERKLQLSRMFKELHAETCVAKWANSVEGEEQALSAHPCEPFAVSSALGDDPDMIDASVLMSSGYLQPLVPSELDYFVHQLLEPDNVARLRHLSAAKFRAWQYEVRTHTDLPKQTLLSPAPCSPGVTSNGSIPDEPSKVLVPHGSSSYFRSTSPSASSASGNPLSTSAYALGRTSDPSSTTEPFRQVRLAKWAQDLQRSLDNERRRYKEMYLHPPADWTSSPSDSEKQALTTHQSLITTTPTSSRTRPHHQRPAKGRLGGDLGIIDPRDPLGVLAFSQATRRRGWLALQVAGGCGLVGTVAWWVLRNWMDVQEFWGWGQTGVVTVNAVPAPARGWWEDWRQVFGWG